MKPGISETDVDLRFVNHKVTQYSQDKINQVTYHFWSTARSLAVQLPDCRETSLAMTKLEEAHQAAVAAIVRNDPDVDTNASVQQLIDAINRR